MKQRRPSMPSAVICSRVTDASTESIVFRIPGASDKIESVVALMPLGIIEIMRTDIVAIAHGREGM